MNYGVNILNNLLARIEAMSLAEYDILYESTTQTQPFTVNLSSFYINTYSVNVNEDISIVHLNEFHSSDCCFGIAA